MSGRKGLLVSTIICIALLFSFYGKNILHPNEYVFTAANDGLKTYYNFAWHGYHDTSFLELNGMNYPYGEFILFEDSLPLFSTVKKLLSFYYPKINNYSVGILNILILLSFIIGVVFFYAIFRLFELPPIVSALSSNAVVFLSSQITLLSPIGHLGLSFVCFFSMGWYFLLKYLKGPKQFKWSIIIALNVLLWAFTHIYLGFILLFFLFGVHILYIIFNYKKFSNFKLRFLHVSIQVFFPILLILLLYKFFDTHPDRIDMPFLIDYKASFHSVFLSDTSPFKPVYNLFFNTDIIKTQLWGNTGNYIGISSNIAIISFIALAIVYFLRKKGTNPFTYFKGNLYFFLGSAVLMLFFSMAIPTRFIPLSIINSLSVLKQFLALGRFAWAFYFVITTCSIVFLFKYLKQFSKGYILFYLLLSLYFVEAIPNHLNISKISAVSKNPFTHEFLREDERVLMELNDTDYQAIIPLPYYFKFNLPFSTKHTDESIYGSMVASVHSGLPILSIYLSRPSVSEGLSIFKLFNPYPYQQMLPQLVKDGRDLAVVLYNTDSLTLEPNAKSILNRSKLIKMGDKYSIYTLTVADMFSSNQAVPSQTSKFNKNELFQKHKCWVTDTNQFIFYTGFDSLPSNVTYRGKGAYVGKKSEYNEICKFSTNKLNRLVEYKVSFWYYNHIWDQTFNSCIIAETDSTQKNLQWLTFSPIKTTIIDGWWYLSEYSFKPVSTNSTITIMFKGGREFEDWFSIDELLIRPANFEVYQYEYENDTNLLTLNNKLVGQKIIDLD